MEKKDEYMSEDEAREFLNAAAGIDKYLQYIMRELEHAEEMIYNENLSAANYIYWKTKKEVLSEVRDKYCSFLDSKRNNVNVEIPDDLPF